ncbi:MAG: CpsD/CapB family tyrosine-protein kinase [Bacillota bacterium]|nr:CpsD/CapB family tyrosine-protein kinase [Bacillota bacterium]
MDESKIIYSNDPKSLGAEAYKVLKKNIRLLSLDKEVKIIMVASAGAKEGRTTIASNLSSAMAEAGKKVILIDCDERQPNVQELFNIQNEVGLSDILAGKEEFDENLYGIEGGKPYVLTSGSKLSNYEELLDSDGLKSFLEDLRQSFDYIIIDTPPTTTAADAQIIARYVDGCIYVVRAGKFDRVTIAKGQKLLEAAGANILGFVLNRFEEKKKFFSEFKLRRKKDPKV